MLARMGRSGAMVRKHTMICADVYYFQILITPSPNFRPLIPQVVTSNIHALADSTRKRLVLALVDALDRHNASTDSGRFFATVTRAARLVREDRELDASFQFGWLDDATIVNPIVMGRMSAPGE